MPTQNSLTDDAILFTAGYIGEFEFVDDHRSGKIVVELNGRLNKCGVISPRFDVGVKEIESWTARLLPSRQVFHWKRLISFVQPSISYAA